MRPCDLDLAYEYTRSPALAAARILQTRGENAIARMAPRHWYRADTYTLSSGNLATLTNRGSAGGSLEPVGTVAAPALDALVNGAHSIALTGANHLSASHGAAEFKFLHDGTGGEYFIVFAPTSVSGLQVVFATVDNTVSRGIHTYITTSQPVQQTVSGSTGTVAGGTSDIPINVATYLGGSFKSADPVTNLFYVRAAAGTATPTVSTADPNTTLTIGARDAGSARLTGRIADILIFNRVLSEHERQLVREYIQARYAITAPVVSETDRSILSLTPFSWIRADYRAESGGKITSFADKARPGHSLAQGTTGNQVASPTFDASLGNQLSAPFTGAQWYVSSLAAAAWKFLHDGAGFEIFVALVPTSSSGAGRLACTQTGGAPGFDIILHNAAGRLDARVYNGATFIVSNLIAAQVVSGSPTYYNFSYGSAASPNQFLNKERTLLASGAQGGAPSAANPGQTLSVGGSATGLAPVQARVADILIFDRVLTDAHRDNVRSYLKRYGFV